MDLCLHTIGHPAPPGLRAQTYPGFEPSSAIPQSRISHPLFSACARSLASGFTATGRPTCSMSKTPPRIRVCPQSLRSTPLRSAHLRRVILPVPVRHLRDLPSQQSGLVHPHHGTDDVLESGFQPEGLRGGVRGVRDDVVHTIAPRRRRSIASTPGSLPVRHLPVEERVHLRLQIRRFRPGGDSSSAPAFSAAAPKPSAYVRTSSAVAVIPTPIPPWFISCRTQCQLELVSMMV